MQVLAHVSNTPFELIEYTQSKDILVEAYSPIAHGEMLKNQEITALSEKYGVFVPQLYILRKENPCRAKPNFRYRMNFRLAIAKVAEQFEQVC